MGAMYESLDQPVDFDEFLRHVRMVKRLLGISLPALVAVQVLDAWKLRQSLARVELGGPERVLALSQNVTSLVAASISVS